MLSLATVSLQAQGADNKTIIRRYVQEVLNKGNMEVFDELIGKDFVYNGPQVAALQRSEAPTMGKDAVKKLLADTRKAAPDLKVTINHLIAEGDMVTIGWTAKGRPKGSALNLTATGDREVSVSGITIARIRDGKIVEDHTYWNAGGLVNQLRRRR